MADALLAELVDWLRIPSISTGGGLPADLRRAAEWVCQRVDAAGGRAELHESAGNPLAYGELAATEADAPTVLIYGHYDVQAPGPAEAWASQPFEPEMRDGRLYARGASDDKGNFLPLLHVACRLARDGVLPVNVRVLVEGEEEVGSAAAVDWIRSDEGLADCAVVFDASMADEGTPAITVGLRGMVQLRLSVRTARRDLHSGLYGGSVLNAAHVLHGMLSTVLPGPDGRLREELRAGVEPPDEREVASWAALKPGEQVIAEAGGRPVHPGAAEEFYERNGADASLDVNEISTGEPRTIVPAAARASLSLRLAPRQEAERMAAVLEDLLREAAPPDVELGVERLLAEPALFPVESTVMRLAAGAIERACGRPPAFVRSGGSIPVVAELAARGIPTVVSGFALADDDIHAPNESFRVESLRLGERAAHELYAALSRL